MKLLDNSNKRGNAAVDDILEELKGKGGQLPAAGAPNVDAILAEMGLGGPKKPSPFDNVRPGAPVPPPVPPKQAVPPPVPEASAVLPLARQTALQTPAPAPEEMFAEPFPAPEPTAEEEPLGQALFEQFYGDEPFEEEPLPPAEKPAAPPRKKSASGTMIWDIELEHTAMGPRVGKAAALDKVDPDKFVGDRELSRWFADAPDRPTSKRESRKAEKEARRRQAQEQQQTRRQAKVSALPEEPPEGEDITAVVEAWSQNTTLQSEDAYTASNQRTEFAEWDAPTAPTRHKTLPESEFDPQPEGPTLGGFGPPKNFDFHEKPARKGFFGRLFGKDDEDDEDEFAAAYAPPVEDDWATEEPGAYEDAFAVHFEEDSPAASAPAHTAGKAAVRATAPPEATTASFAALYRGEDIAPAQPTKSAAQANTPAEPIEADTASFTAAYKPQPSLEPLPPVPANTAGFAAAMHPGSASAQEEAGPNTAEFAAALGKGPVSRSGSPTPDAVGDGGTTVFGAVRAPDPFASEAGKAANGLASEATTETNGLAGAPGSNTHAFEPGKTEDAQRVPTAAFTQEFASENGPAIAEDGPVPEDRSLFLDDMVDDRFRQFFSETVIMDRPAEEQAERARRRRKRTRSAILTGEFARMAELVEQADMADKTGEALPENESFDDYNRPQDAPAVESDIAALRTSLSRRTVGTAILAVLLLWMGLSFSGTVPLPEWLAFATSPFVFAGVYLALVLGAIALNFTTVATGLAGLFAAPTVDCAPALAALAGLLQGAMLLAQAITRQSAEATLFGALAALALCLNALGKRVRAVSILRSFQLASAGMDHSAAYTLDSSNELAYNITRGLEEEDPTLLVSRPTTLVKGFLRQSFSQRATDHTGRTLGWVTLGAGLVSTALTLIMGGAQVPVFAAVSAFTAVLCITAPFSSSLVSGVPSLLLQRATARLGAVVPGWSAIEELGRVNVVMATARDIFPPSSVSLRGIKTFEKERIDVAILYAASVLIEGCDTLRDIFSGVIQGKSDMLYKVESLVREPGRGFTAWVQNNRVVIGSREMLQKHDVTPPPMELEVKHVPNGHTPVYLAVSGKLFAMFIVGYRADPEVRDTLGGLIKSGVSLLVTSDDMNVTNELIEHAYRLPHGVVKVLGRRELDVLEPLTAYAPDSEGVMTHIGSFASFIGGMRSAAGCAASERMSSIVQLASVILAGVLCLLLAFGGSLATLSISIALLYQAAWTLLVSIMPFMRRY